MLLAGALLLGWAAGPRTAQAQGTGSISGIVRPGAGSDVSTAAVLVQLVELRQGPSVVQEARTTAGRFRFEIQELDPTVNYLVRAVVDGVGYLSDGPLQLSPQRPAAQVDIVVFGASSERPPLRAAISAITIVGVDRDAGTIALQREDAIVNPSTRSWTGDAEGVTLRLPAPPGTLTAEGQAWFGGLPTTGDLSGGPEGLTVRVPFRPGETMLITRYTVTANVLASRYEVGLAAVLPTEQLQVMVPARFARQVIPVGDSLSGAPLTIESERMLVVQRSRPANPGDVVTATVTGLAAPVAPHPLTRRSGAALGALLTFVLVAGAGVFATARVRQRQPVPV